MWCCNGFGQSRGFPRSGRCSDGFAQLGLDNSTATPPRPGSADSPATLSSGLDAAAALSAAAAATARASLPDSCRRPVLVFDVRPGSSCQGYWQRKVDASGRISLYSRNYTLHRRLRGQTLWIRFDPSANSWTCWDDKGRQVALCPSLEINAHSIRQLDVHCSAAQHNQSATKPVVAPLS